MFDQIAYDEKVARLNITPARRLDALSAREIARHRRRMAKFNFVGEAVRWLVAALARWHREAVLRRELAALPDSMLADIGIRRDQIGAVVARRPARESAVPAPAVAAGSGQKPAPTRPLAVVAGAGDDKDLAA